MSYGSYKHDVRMLSEHDQQMLRSFSEDSVSNDYPFEVANASFVQQSTSGQSGSGSSTLTPAVELPKEGENALEKKIEVSKETDAFIKNESGGNAGARPEGNTGIIRKR